MAEQRTKEWYEARLGKFTSSSIHKLMGVKGLGATGESYCFELAVDIVEGKDWTDEFTSFDMQRGIELEPFAFELFKKKMQMEFVPVTKTEFIRLNENEGSSPDGLVGNDAVLEIKCPKREKFFNIIAFGVNAIDTSYIYQMQHQMSVTNRHKAYFLNYYIHNSKELFHIIEIERDDSIINKMNERISQAIEIRDSYVQKIIDNIQYRKEKKLIPL